MLQLNIKSYPIKLIYNIQDASLNQQTTPPSVEVQTTPPSLELRQPRGELTIDHTNFRYSIGLKNFDTFERDHAELSRQKLLENIREIVEKGNELARIYDKSITVPEVVTRFNQKGPLEITWAPISKPEISYKAIPAEVEVTPGKVNIEVQLGKVNREYQPPSFDMKVTQYPKVEISAVDVKV